MAQDQKQGIYITQEDIDTALAMASPREQSDADKPLFLDEADIIGSGPEGDSEDADSFGLLSQDDIESLLMGALDESGDEVEIADGSDSPEGGKVFPHDDPDRLLSGASEDDGQDVESDVYKAISVDPEPVHTIGDVAGSVEPEMASEFRNDGENLISQSDLNQLLGGDRTDADLEAPSSEPRRKLDHISQDDINRLLKESLEEEEDLTKEDADSVEESDSQEPVNLAADEDPPEPSLLDEKTEPVEKIQKTTGGRKRKKRKKRIWENRLAWAAAAGVVLVVSLTVMMMFSEPTETAPQPKMVTFPLNRMENGPADATLFSNTRVRLRGFLVLAPPNSAAVAYVAADLTLDFSDSAIVAAIKENEAFVRDIIYGTISGELMNRDISAIDEVSMELAIRKALGRIMAREAIDRIAFDRFSLV